MPFSPPSAQFTEEEVELYKHRYEERFDLTHDDHYNQWVKLNHPVFESLHPRSLRTQLFAESNGLSPTSDSTTQDAPISLSNESPELSSDNTSPENSLPSVSHSKLSEFLVIPDPPAKKDSARAKTTIYHHDLRRKGFKLQYTCSI